MQVAVYPGSFDPVTHGHMDVVDRAAAVFDRVVIAVLANPRKQPLLATAERVAVLRRSLDETLEPATAGRLEVAAFEGLTVDFCHARGAAFIVRGLRAISDFEAEIQLAHNNRILAPDVDTVFFMTSLEHSYVSSSLVKEIAMFGGDISAMVPLPAAEALRRAVAR
ncbi:MAG TPA: pantetheine-phosphate adenylyltransferase [Candidatus Limnocylindria bacterium]|jgi:pantetheine-phosphate adenylyltransferase|nr:pantetheine-phosphate adenylyltransferase [Candidatus Limnocylindria bacterium]